MNCQEVMELMQRYVDHDLNEQETSLMHDHVGQCPDCKTLLDRLVALSQGLEQLPRVEPPYSLVDAILPKLNLPESAQSELSEMTALTPPNRRRSASRRIWITRISSIAIACIIGVIIAINGPILDQMGSRSNDEMASLPESASGETFIASDALSGSAELRVSDQYGHPPVEGSAKQVLPDDSVKNKAGATGSMSYQGNGTDNGIDDNQDLNAFGNRTDTPEGPSVMEFPDAAGEAISPDGAWRAVLAEGVLMVYAAQDGQAAFTHDPAPGTISNLVWRDDSSALDFTYTDAEGRLMAQSLLVPEMQISQR